MGHKKLCGIFAVDDIQGNERYRGFIKSCMEHGVEKAEENVIWYTTNESSRGFTELIDGSEGSRAATGVVCYNDRLAIDLINFCKGRSITVPNDISIVGIPSIFPLTVKIEGIIIFCAFSIIDRLFLYKLNIMKRLIALSSIKGYSSLVIL